MPKRIQLSRRKGWRKPEGCIVVARPSRWGNPFKIGEEVPGYITPLTRAETIEKFHSLICGGGNASIQLRNEIRRELGGHDLACWCPLDQPCHADVLLEIANSPMEKEKMTDQLEMMPDEGKQDSPRLAWMNKHYELTVYQLQNGRFQFSYESGYKLVFSDKSYDSREDACIAYATARGIPLWNEEEFVGGGK